MNGYWHSVIQPALVVLILVMANLQENRSEVLDNMSRMINHAGDDSEGNDLDYFSNELTSSPDSTTKIPPHFKTSEHSKPHYNPKHFGYGKHDGPEMWPKMFEKCAGSNQSPVVLDTTTAVTRHRPHIMWWNYSLRPRAMTLANNGHTVVLTAKWLREEDKPYHWSPPSQVEYVFHSLHFHWGEDDHSGSEHRINNEKFALEMHAVHYRRDLHSLENAGHQKTGIRVIGVFYRISENEHNNTGLQEIVQFLKMVRLAEKSTVVPRPFPISRLVPQFHSLYFNYNGSLTTPPCAETVSIHI